MRHIVLEILGLQFDNNILIEKKISYEERVSKKNIIMQSRYNIEYLAYLECFTDIFYIM